MDYYYKYLKDLAKKGGPEESDYYNLEALVIEIAEKIKTGEIDRNEKQHLIDAFGDSFSPNTMQGFAYHKPHGYAGDFEIIDRIYTRYISKEKHLSKWDVYWQSRDAAVAVRNRVYYLHDVINKLGEKEIKVLNLASGPGRDMLYYFEQYNNKNVFFDCVEQDNKAIEHAKALCSRYTKNISFYKKNVLRFNTASKYSLIWSAGLFDYFDDRSFTFLLKRLIPFLDEGGAIVIGNFSTKNPSKSYMELFEWKLQHRSPQALLALAEEAGMEARNVSIRKEGSGVNLFLHYKKPT